MLDDRQTESACRTERRPIFEISHMLLSNCPSPVVLLDLYNLERTSSMPAIDALILRGPT
jgi:hypothetical protein